MTITLWNTLNKESISDWTNELTSDLECVKNEYTGAIHFTPKFDFQNIVFSKMTEPNSYTVTAKYKLNDKIKNAEPPINFEMGMAWYNYEFSKSADNHIFAVM
tara:strand:- start:422 stop:730 length:309 start_codon:yes stop_codon:yes gene_type:complete